MDDTERTPFNALAALLLLAAAVLGCWWSEDPHPPLELQAEVAAPEGKPMGERAAGTEPPAQEAPTESSPIAEADPLLVMAVASVRIATREAREDASLAQAPRLAAPLFARAVEVQERAEALRKEGDLTAARRAFAESRDLFAHAAREARDAAFLANLEAQQQDVPE